MLSLYMDHQVASGITEGLRRCGIDVLTALDDSHAAASDVSISRRVTQLGRIVFTRDEDFPAPGRATQGTAEVFGGIEYAHQLQATNGQASRDLELICRALPPEEMQNEIVLLPFNLGEAAGHAWGQPTSSPRRLAGLRRIAIGTQVGPTAVRGWFKIERRCRVGGINGRTVLAVEFPLAALAIGRLPAPSG